MEVIEKKFYNLAPESLVITGEVSFQKWEELGKSILGFERRVPWYVGDWLLYGEHQYGEMYAQALELTGLDIGTLKNYKYCSKQFEPSRRRMNLSHSHHYAVCGLPPKDQEIYLDIAVKEGLSVAELRYRCSGGVVDESGIGTPMVTTDIAGPVNKKTIKKTWIEIAKQAWKNMPQEHRKEFLEWTKESD